MIFVSGDNFMVQKTFTKFLVVIIFLQASLIIYILYIQIDITDFVSMNKKEKRKEKKNPT